MAIANCHFTVPGFIKLLKWKSGMSGAIWFVDFVYIRTSLPWMCRCVNVQCACFVTRLVFSSFADTFLLLKRCDLCVSQFKLEMYVTLRVFCLFVVDFIAFFHVASLNVDGVEILRIKR